MNYSTKQKDAEDFDDFIFENKFSSPPMVGETSQALIFDDVKVENTSGSIGKRIVSNLLIFVGGFLLYGTTLIFFQIFIAGLAVIASPWKIFIYFTIGLILLFIENGLIKKKSDWLSYGTIPLAASVLGILFTLAPADWSGKLFGIYMPAFFLPVLFLFYYVRERFDKSVN